MDRRGFLRSIGLGIGGIALEQAIPLGRVWSFPKKIVIARDPFELSMERSQAATYRWVERMQARQRFVEGRVIVESATGVVLVSNVDKAKRVITLDSIPA